MIPSLPQQTARHILQVCDATTGHTVANVGMCDTPERAGAIMDALRNRDELAEFLLEAHQPEIDAGHHGDDPRTCSYCKAIRKAGLTITRNR